MGLKSGLIGTFDGRASGNQCPALGFGGRIWAKSNPGRETTSFFTVPTAKAQDSLLSLPPRSGSELEQAKALRPNLIGLSAFLFHQAGGQ